MLCQVALVSRRLLSEASSNQRSTAVTPTTVLPGTSAESSTAPRLRTHSQAVKHDRRTSLVQISSFIRTIRLPGGCALPNLRRSGFGVYQPHHGKLPPYPTIRLLISSRIQWYCSVNALYSSEFCGSARRRFSNLSLSQTCASCMVQILIFSIGRNYSEVEL